MLGIWLEILRMEFLQTPNHDQADQGFFSAAVSVCGASGFGDGSKDPPLQLPLVPPDSDESAGLKPRATASCSASFSRCPCCGSEEARRSFSSAVSLIKFICSMVGRMD